MTDDTGAPVWPQVFPPDPVTVGLEQDKLRAEIAKIKADRWEVEVNLQAMRATIDKTMAETRSARASATVQELIESAAVLKDEQEHRLNKFHHVYVFDNTVSETSVKACIGSPASL